MAAVKAGEHVVQMFPDILNRDAFYNREHPTLDPSSLAYIEYWRKEKKRCIEGWWVQEEAGHWRWMNPTLYHYINHCEILIVDEENNARYYSLPDLCDTEFIITNYMTACFGFSGFTDDLIYTCNELVKKYNDAKRGEEDAYGRAIKITALDQRRLDKDPYVKKADGTFKEYIEPYEYLKLHHDRPMGYHLYGNVPQNAFCFTARSSGKSYITASEAVREYSFDGLKYYDNTLFPTPKKIVGEVMVGASDPTKTDELTMKIAHMLTNYKGAYEGKDRAVPSPFSKNSKGSLTTGSTYQHIYKKKVKGQWTTAGSKSVIYTVNYGSDVNAGASKRLSKQFVDEVGLIPDADEAHGVSKYSKQGGGSKYGVTVYTGTGGQVLKIEASKKMFYNPAQYDIYSIEDVWENKGRIGLFIPGYYSLRHHKDENGNTRLLEALEEVLGEREKLASFVDPLPLIQEKMYMPLKPSEMFYSIADNILPGALALERINELEEDKLWEKCASIGRFGWGDVKKRTAVWEEVPDLRKNVILDLSLERYKDKTGAFVIYQHPLEGLEKYVHKVVYDPYRKDGKGESYASILVYVGIPRGGQGMSDTLVGEYIGRPVTVDEAHTIAIQAAMYFNAKILVERNVVGFIKWAKDNQYVHLLQEEPYEAINEGVKNRKKTFQYGVEMTAPLKVHALQLLRKWMLEPRKRDDEGKVLKTSIGIQYSLRLLNETANFGEGNFDHISAMLLLMLWIDQDGKQTREEKTEERVEDFEKFFKERSSSYYNPLLR